MSGCLVALAAVGVSCAGGGVGSVGVVWDVSDGGADTVCPGVVGTAPGDGTDVAGVMPGGSAGMVSEYACGAVAGADGWLSSYSAAAFSG